MTTLDRSVKTDYPLFSSEPFGVIAYTIDVSAGTNMIDYLSRVRQTHVQSMMIPNTKFEEPPLTLIARLRKHLVLIAVSGTANDRALPC